MNKDKKQGGKSYKWSLDLRNPKEKFNIIIVKGDWRVVSSK